MTPWIAAGGAAVFAMSSIVALWWLVFEVRKNSDLRVENTNLGRDRKGLVATNEELTAYTARLVEQQRTLTRRSRYWMEKASANADPSELFDEFFRDVVHEDEADHAIRGPGRAVVPGHSATKAAARDPDGKGPRQ